ncbi:hypothetical protein QBC40DRAFT_236388 [Triangularia verruculosa]|uniref:DUF1996 domain-containing protein n=1 Tax=Triangularia verruculosa TaxID=2587418 RepID=A0AAN6X873_9PEZI|nr:hypothetical protein QBC40DRAFT_236388 [Triangularia verruculosa]
MSCSQLVRDRIDPLVNPGLLGTSHIHQIVGGNSFNTTMSPTGPSPANLSTCTTCTFTDDFSNYWTAIMYFQARNGSYKRVKQLGSLYHEQAREGGITIYYFPQFLNPQPRTIKAFAPGFRMRVGHPDRVQPVNESGHARADSNWKPTALYDGITYTCQENEGTRFSNLTNHFPDRPCPAGIITTLPFPSCWDGKNLDSPDHQSHVSFAEGGTVGYTKGGACPASHPVMIPQIMLEIRWDTTEFNDAELWPEDTTRQPFLWSFGDRLGYGHHGDYIFGWRGDTLQRTFDSLACSGDQICGMPTQTIPKANECVGERRVVEEADGWLQEMPGGVVGREW